MLYRLEDVDSGSIDHLTLACSDLEWCLAHSKQANILLIIKYI